MPAGPQETQASDAHRPQHYRGDVRALYEQLPFPMRDPNDETKRLVTMPADMLARINHYCFSGRQTFGDNFRALVAGGGTGDAAIFLAVQLAERGAGRVTYLDISAQSMAIAQQRAAIRGLTNIDWVHASILDIPNLTIGPFDYINCVGVIHHLEEPRQGLLCLKMVMAEQGAMALMVYGRYGRADVTILQDMFKLVVPDTTDFAANVEVAKKILAALPSTNAYMRGRDRGAVLKSLLSDDANLADIFLHPCDWSFSAAELEQLIERDAGLHLQAFTTFVGGRAICRLQYDPALYIADPDLRSRLSALPRGTRWQIAEMMDGSLHLHTVYVTRQSATIARFDDPSLIPFAPTRFDEAALQLIARAGRTGIRLALWNGTTIDIALHAVTLRYLALMDGVRRGVDIVAAVGASEATSRQALSTDLTLLNNLDWVLLRAPSVDAFSIHGERHVFDGATLGPQPWKIAYRIPVVHPQ